MLKRLFSIITISLILTGSFFSVYNIKYSVYADSTTDQWTQVTTNQQLVEAFKYYCKSRDLTIEGSVADAVTSFTTKTFNGICNTLGIDITALQAEIKYQTDGNTGLKFLFSATGVSAYNRIFSQFLQDNDIDVGDSVNNENLYSGEYFTDDDGNSCLVYYSSTFQDGPNNASIVSKIGTSYVHTPQYYTNLASNTGFTTHINNVAHSFYFDVTSNVDYIYFYYNNTPPAKTFYYRNMTQYDSLYAKYNVPCLAIFKVSTNYYLVALEGHTISYNQDILQIASLAQLNQNGQSVNATNCNIYITTNNSTINNNTYEGDTIINNNGDVINNNYPDPNPNPSPDPPTIPDSGGWQDFTLPEMPNDWLIYGMERKFPFDIPFNILFALSLLNHEPEIPKFEGDIDLKVCTWHYDIDLTPFDDIATILRRFEVLAFIIGLAILTKNLIDWG